MNTPDPYHEQALASGEHPWAAPLRRARKRWSRTELAVTLALTALLIWRKAPATLAHAAGVLVASVWLQMLIFSAVLGFIYGVVSLPFQFWRGHILEKRFGLSTQTVSGWLADQLKGLAIGLVLGAVVVTGLAATLIFWPAQWWSIAAAGSTVFGIILTRVAPQLILPLFFKLRPISDESLQGRFKELARRTATPVLGIFEIDMSRRTRAANAAVIGFGSTRRAVVGDTLLEKFSPDEIEFVLAHELGHHRYHDLWSGVAVGGAVQFLVLGLTNVVLRRFVPELVGPHVEILFWIALIAAAIGALFAPLTKLFSRAIEARADRFAAASTSNAVAGASAFRRLGYQNMAVFNPPRWEEALFYTHPSIGRRIAKLEKLQPRV